MKTIPQHLKSGMLSSIPRAFLLIKNLKRKLFFSGLVLSVLTGYSQTSWNVNGNSASSGNFIGTTNNQSLIFKTNGTERMSLSTSGTLKLGSLGFPSGSLSGLVTANNSGELNRTNFTNAATDVFTGTGIFASLPSLTGWTLDRSIISTEMKVGVNTDSPLGNFGVRGPSVFEGNVQIQGTLKVGMNSIFMAANDIYTDNGRLRINGFYTTGNYNTEINPIDGVVLVGLPESSINSSQSAQIHLMAKDFAMITGNNPTLTFKKQAANYNGDMAIEYYDIGTGQTGINFWNPFPNTNGFTNFLLFVGSKGNVGIGTGDPQHKLDVCGTIRGKEVLVQIGWCDYVFDHKYKLMPLPELDLFIRKNHHLPNIPAASDVEKDGLKLAEMTAKQMEKIEELTLYIIDLQKQVNALKEQLDEAKK